MPARLTEISCKTRQGFFCTQKAQWNIIYFWLLSCTIS
jgi:hypothetical protein